MYDWFPIVFIVFKVVVLGTGMFFAIKWHHDQAKKDEEDKEDVQAKRDALKKQARDLRITRSASNWVRFAFSSMRTTFAAGRPSRMKFVCGSH